MECLLLIEVPLGSKVINYYKYTPSFLESHLSGYCRYVPSTRCTCLHICVLYIAVAAATPKPTKNSYQHRRQRFHCKLTVKLYGHRCTSAVTNCLHVFHMLIFIQFFCSLHRLFTACIINIGAKDVFFITFTRCPIKTADGDDGQAAMLCLLCGEMVCTNSLCCQKPLEEDASIKIGGLTQHTQVYVVFWHLKGTKTNRQYVPSFSIAVYIVAVVLVLA